MSRLIDADAFIEFLKDAVKQQKYEDTKIDGLLTVADVIDAVISELDGTSLAGFKNAPTIEPERKTGVWLDDDEDGKVMTSGYCPYCSVCKEMAECITKYCPHCGARMEGVE